MIRRIAIPLTLLMLAACSSGDGGDATVPAGSDAAPESVVDAGSEATVPSDDAPETTASSVSDATTSTTVAVAVPIEPLINGALLIPTRTPVIVETLRPMLEWEPVEGADAYSVVVLDEAGEPYWVWSGSESEVPLGGAASSDFGIGPIIGIGYSWSVAAFGANGEFLAVSGEVPISTE